MAQRFRVRGHDRHSLLSIEFGAYEAESMSDAITKLEAAGFVVNEIAAAGPQGPDSTVRKEPRFEIASRIPTQREGSGPPHEDERRTQGQTRSTVTIRIDPEAHWPAIKILALGIAGGALIMMVVGYIWTFVILGLFQGLFRGNFGDASAALIMSFITMGLILLGAYLIWKRREQKIPRRSA